VSLLEKCGKYKKAKKWLQKLQLQAVQDDFLTFIKDTESRIKTKKSLSKKYKNQFFLFLDDNFFSMFFQKTDVLFLQK
jgi:hypothetical protein